MNPLTLQMFGVPVAGQRPPLAEADGFGDFAVVMDMAETADRALSGDPLIELPLADPALPDPSMLFAPPLILAAPQRPVPVGPQSQPVPELRIAPAIGDVAAPNGAQIASASMVLAPPMQDLPLQSPPLQKQAPDLPPAAMMVPQSDVPLGMPLPQRHEAGPQPAVVAVLPPEPQRAADTVMPADLTPDRVALPQRLGETVLEFRSNSSTMSEPPPRRPENRAVGQAAVPVPPAAGGPSTPVTPDLPPAAPIMQAANTPSQSIAVRPKLAPPVSDLTSSPAAILTTPATVSADAPLPRPETMPPDFVRTYPVLLMAQTRPPAAPQGPIGGEPVQTPVPLIAPLIPTISAAGTMPPEPVITPPAEPPRIATPAQAPDQLAEARPQIALRAPPKLPTQAVQIDEVARFEPSAVDAAFPALAGATSSAESAWQMRLQLPAPRLRQPLPAAAKPDLVPPHARSDEAKPPAAQVNARVEPPLPVQTVTATSPDLSPETGPALALTPDFNADPPAAEAASPESGLIQLHPTAAAMPEPAIRPPQSEVATPIAMPTAIPAKVAAQIVPHAQRAKTEVVEVVLHPEELGSVKFQIQPQGESVRVVLTVERPETLEFLRRHADHLVQEFRQAGFSGATLSFGSWDQRGGQPDAPPPPPVLAVEDAVFAPPATPRVVAHSATEVGQGLNLRL